jgi:hypothetical protein
MPVHIWRLYSVTNEFYPSVKYPGWLSTAQRNKDGLTVSSWHMKDAYFHVFQSIAFFSLFLDILIKIFNEF